MHDFAAQQGFEAGERGDGVHFVGMRQAGNNIVFRRHHIGMAGAIGSGDMAAAVAAQHVGMGLVDNISIGVELAHGLEQLQIFADFR